ncbi:uncharacterized protein EI97DRAFT_431938 [Westerdykella ornata]|uniref:Protein kinase domain-containing protein n=1 Tax=Westerdykella ornata TaxID=318751 RepID=A0A6A6JNP4_WESOR|nr:uncharacterized protein EI97DRAFT_431938 [Westerdykella ornata]KAF2277865.1 hypothetical protein EI97DRAFT_431938 [Westerdykella ornata]
MENQNYAGFQFGMDFSNMNFANTAMPNLSEGNTDTDFFLFDEGVDTAYSQFDSSFASMNTEAYQNPTLNQTMDNTLASGSTFSQLDFTSPSQIFGTYPVNSMKRPLQIDTQDAPQRKRHQGAGCNSNFTSPLLSSASSIVEVGLNDQAADVCATWFSKYNVLPSDRHIESLSQLTGEPAAAIRAWFGQMLKHGIAGHDSAYKSQTSLTQSPQLDDTQNQTQFEATTLSRTCDSTTSPLRGGKKGCTPTNDPDLLRRDPNKIFQCTRKCGKRYGRKCDWKRNEEEGYPAVSWKCSLCISQGVDKVKPCFRRYHFKQHFGNIHPGMNFEDYEKDSLIRTDSTFPRHCGFCTHRFESRQDRIDHIAEHFANGKCMLDWKDPEDDQSPDEGDDDSGDDNNAPDSFQGGEGPSSGRPDGQDYSGGKQDEGGDGSNGYNPFGGFGQYQYLSTQLSDAVPASGSNQSSGEPSGCQLADEECFKVGEVSGMNLVLQEVGLDQGKEERCSTFTQDACRLEKNVGASEATILPSLESCCDDGLNTTVSLIPGPSLPPPPLLPPVTQGLMPYTCHHSHENQSAVQNLDDDHSGIVSETVDFKQKMVLHEKALEGDPTSKGAGNGSLWYSDVNTLLEDRRSASPGDPYLESQSFLSVKLLGAGGFSTVDEVVHQDTKLRISRKTLKNREESAIEELKKEVGVLQKLRHPHIIRFLGAYAKDEKVSILLTPVADTTLAVWLQRMQTGEIQRPVGLLDTVLNMFGCLVSSIRYLHEQRPVITHGDIKPQNILVMHNNGEMPHVILSDFGVSSFTDQQEDTAPLTRRYCAPEIPSGVKRDQAADIWSLGCVFIEMLVTALDRSGTQTLEFRKQFSGRHGKYYWQDLAGLHGWLCTFTDQATNAKELVALQTIQSTLRMEPSERPTAAELALIFTPAACCLAWANEQASFPAPHEELDMVQQFLKEEFNKGLDEVTSPGVLPLSQIPQPNPSPVQLKEWLDKCTHGHESCHSRSPEAGKLPTRLLDIRPDEADNGADRLQSIRLIDTAELAGPVEYAALNYTWGDDDLTLSSAMLETDLCLIPRPMLSTQLNDAITAAEHMGLRYIWVDSLCVIQDSEADKQQECAQMASTYRNALITIVVGHANESVISTDMTSEASSSSTSPSTPSHLQKVWQSAGFAWDTRAWVLMERLLCNRILHLTEGQMYWECHSLKASETFPNGLPSLVWEKVHTKPSPKQGSACCQQKITVCNDRHRRGSPDRSLCLGHPKC